MPPRLVFAPLAPHWRSPDMSVWRGRVDSTTDRRAFLWHQVVQKAHFEPGGPTGVECCVPGVPQISHEKRVFALLGYEVEEGVRRNHGRPGAAEGPAALRRALASRPVHFNENTLLIDAGDITFGHSDLFAPDPLLSAQTGLAVAVGALHANGYIPIVVGGDHSVALGHGMAVYNSFAPDKRVGIINFDAHFDLRPVVDGLGNSGTPFRQLAALATERNLPFHYLCIGAMQMSNTPLLFDAARELGVVHVPRAQLSPAHIDTALDTINKFLEGVDVVYLTVDLDVLDQSRAPGVSAPAPNGITPDSFFPLFLPIVRSGKVVSFDMAELSPCHEPVVKIDFTQTPPGLIRDQRTARLAAAIASEFVTHHALPANL